MSAGRGTATRLSDIFVAVRDELKQRKPRKKITLELFTDAGGEPVDHKISVSTEKLGPVTLD